MVQDDIIQKLVSKREFLLSQDSDMMESIIDDIVKNNYGDMTWEERQTIKDDIKEAIIHGK